MAAGHHKLNRLTVIVDTPAGEVRGSSVVKISNTETMGPLVLMEARGVRSKTRGEAVALEVLPGRWLFALLSGDDDGKGNAGQLAYHAVRHGETHNPSDRNYEADMRDLRAQLQTLVFDNLQLRQELNALRGNPAALKSWIKTERRRQKEQDAMDDWY